MNTLDGEMGVVTVIKTPLATIKWLCLSVLVSVIKDRCWEVLWEYLASHICGTLIYNNLNKHRLAINWNDEGLGKVLGIQ